MANPTATQTNIQSEILAYEELKEYGYCRVNATFDNDPLIAGVGLGTLFARTVDESASLTVYGAWAPVPVADLADAATAFAPTADTHVEVGIMIGHGKLGLATDEAFTVADATQDIVLLVRGAAIVRLPYINYTGTATAASTANITNVIQNNMVGVMPVDSFAPFDGTYSDVTPIT